MDEPTLMIGANTVHTLGTYILHALKEQEADIKLLLGPNEGALSGADHVFAALHFASRVYAAGLLHHGVDNQTLATLVQLGNDLAGAHMSGQSLEEWGKKFGPPLSVHTEPVQ